MSGIMFIVTRVIFVVVLVFSLPSSESTEEINGYCDAKGSCSSEAKNIQNNEKYLLYDVNPPEGFNLRRDVYMRFAIMMAEAKKLGNKKNWNLVLPPWYNLYHWKNDGFTSDPIPWSKFFDMESMRSFASVIDLYELFAKTKSKKMTIDRVYALENFEDAFEFGDFEEKWEVNRQCKYDGYYWDYKNITVQEVVCIKFQGRISQLWEIIALHPSDKIVMFDNGEISLHNHYGDKNYWNCRKSMRYNGDLIARARKYREQRLRCIGEEKCNNYISIHWRRQDFARSRQKEVPSVEGSADQIEYFIKKNAPHIVNVFIATDAEDQELKTLIVLLSKMGYKIHIFVPSDNELSRYKDGGIAIIDQIICSHAAYFIGTHESTFTFRIYEEREILGFNTETTFNRLCPDKGTCTNPSVWKLVE